MYTTVCGRQKASTCVVCCLWSALIRTQPCKFSAELGEAFDIHSRLQNHAASIAATPHRRYTEEVGETLLLPRIAEPLERQTPLICFVGPRTPAVQLVRPRHHRFEQILANPMHLLPIPTLGSYISLRR